MSKIDFIRNLFIKNEKECFYKKLKKRNILYSRNIYLIYTNNQLSFKFIFLLF